jgi:hypothetical protein
MSRSSTLLVQNKLTGLKYTKDHSVVINRGKLEKNSKFKALRLRVYRHILETIVSTLMVILSLALYKVTGLHAWWIQIVAKFV